MKKQQPTAFRRKTSVIGRTKPLTMLEPYYADCLGTPIPLTVGIRACLLGYAHPDLAAAVAIAVELAKIKYAPEAIDQERVFYANWRWNMDGIPTKDVSLHLSAELLSALDEYNDLVVKSRKGAYRAAAYLIYRGLFNISMNAITEVCR